MSLLYPIWRVKTSLVMRNTLLNITFLALAIGVLSSCKIIKGVSYLKRKTVKTEQEQIGERDFIFVPISHFGQKLFYKSLKDSIIRWKKADYRIYYEQIETEAAKMNVDALTAINLKKKWRRINGGFGMTRSDYEALQKVFKNGITQPEWEDLGITKSDLNADCTIKDIIQGYESRYGKVELSACDTETSLDYDYTCHDALNHDLNPLLIDYRNKNLVDMIHARTDKKIVVVYGALHIKPVIKLLKAKEKD